VSNGGAIQGAQTIQTSRNQPQASNNTNEKFSNGTKPLNECVSRDCTVKFILCFYLFTVCHPFDERRLSWIWQKVCKL